MGARRCFFFFQAEDGIRDVAVTGVQTCALPISGPRTAARVEEVLQRILGGRVRADIAAAGLIGGDAQLAAGAKEKARSHWRAAWIEHPLSPAADTARDRERQLGPGGHIAQILLVRRAEMLLDAHRNREALDQLARIMVPSLCLGGCPGDRSAGGFLKAALGALGAYPEQHQPTPEDVDLTPAEPGDPLACRVKLDEGRAFRKEREYSRARAALAQVVLRCAEPDVRSRALYVLAQLETISGRATGGPVWEALAREDAQAPRAGDPVYNQAGAARPNGEDDKERARLRGLGGPVPGRAP